MAEQPGGFAALLRSWRSRAGLTQQQLADQAGLSQRTVSDLERGVAAIPQKNTARLIADALQLTGQERTQFETVARGRPSEETARATAAATRSLPRDEASFTGRERELEQLTESVAAAGGMMSIHAIGGMAGVGKTAFAVHAAHQLAGQFPGGHVYLLLHGHTPGQQPVDPADALASLLLTVGVPAARIPPGLAERAALWRDRVAGRPLLLILDDAASSEQVQPLLPGAGGSLVLVTSRRHLSALDDATAISLDTLPPDESAALLVRLAGRPGLSPDLTAVQEIVRLCGYLPLAIGMVGRRLHLHPARSVAGQRAELAAAVDRLALMSTEHISVTAAFDLSYANLADDQQLLFRRLGLHPGAEFDAYAAAALGGTSVTAARRGLEGLYDQYLLFEDAQGRYRMHDLIREHARSLAGRLDPEKDRAAAVDRLLGYYQDAAGAANVHIARRSLPGTATDGPPTAAVPALSGTAQTLDWARMERANLLACIDHAAAHDQPDRVAALSAGVTGLFIYDGPWSDAVTRHTAAVGAARQLGDRLAEATALSDLGDARRMTDDYPSAADAQEQALGIYRELGDQMGQANALNCLAVVRALTGDLPAAARALDEALGMYGDLGERPGKSRALTSLGMVRAFTGDFPAAVLALEQALGICRDLGYRPGEAAALSFLGNVRRMTGDYPGAVLALEQALDIHRDAGDRLGQANALNFLGTVRQLTGDYPAAAQALGDALEVYRDLGDRGGEALALNEQGTLYRISGELPLARRSHEQSLALSQEIDSAKDEAQALAGLGRCALADGGVTRGGRLLRQALEIFERTGAVEAAEVAAELDAL